MTTQTPSRVLEEVQKEHNQTAFQAGIIGYQIDCLKREQNILHTKLLNLNEEGAAIQKLAADAKFAAEKSVQNETTPAV